MASIDRLSAASGAAPPDLAELVDASWRGVYLQVMRTRDAVQRSVAAHSYPFVDGEDLEDMGASARRVALDVVFYGDNYQQPLAVFLQACAQRGSGELVHPVFGALRAQLLFYEVEHDAEQPLYCTVRCDFSEQLVDTPAFSQFTPAYRASAIEEAANTALVAGRLPLAQAVQATQTAQGKLGLLAHMASALDEARRYARTVGVTQFQSLGLDYLTAPFAFAQDLQTILASRVQAVLSPYASLQLALSQRAGQSTLGGAAWRRPLADLQQSLLDANAVAAVAVPPFLRAHVQQQQALALALACKGVLDAEIDNTALTPPQIEALANLVRQDLQAALVATRIAWPSLVDNRPVVDGLKATAAAVQEAALALIRLRPPFVTHVVASRMNMHLLAHSLYGDYTRAGELLRLNPAVRSPNTLASGQEVQGYAA